MDYRETDLPKLLERMRTAHTPIHTSETTPNTSCAATF